MTFDEETDDSSRSSDVAIQTSAQSVPSTPSWLGEVAVIAHYLRHQGVLSGIEERVRFARRRFGHYDLIDFVLVLLGYAINGERTLEAFYERVLPFANVFMALFGRDRLPARSTLSRFLAALKQAPVEVLRTLFLEDLVARPLEKEEKPGGLWDRQGNYWVAFDVDGTRQAARQRALPCTPDLSPAHRRLDEVCAPGYLGRKRGETVRTRTTVLQAHTHQWLGTFSTMEALWRRRVGSEIHGHLAVWRYPYAGIRRHTTHTIHRSLPTRQQAFSAGHGLAPI
jgi:hypothetical protein